MRRCYWRSARPRLGQARSESRPHRTRPPRRVGASQGASRIWPPHPAHRATEPSVPALGTTTSLLLGISGGGRVAHTSGVERSRSPARIGVRGPSVADGAAGEGLGVRSGPGSRGFAACSRRSLHLPVAAGRGRAEREQPVGRERGDLSVDRGGTGLPARSRRRPRKSRSRHRVLGVESLAQTVRLGRVQACHFAARDRIGWSCPAAPWNSAGTSPPKVGSATDIPVTRSSSTGDGSGHRRTVALRASAGSPPRRWPRTAGARAKPRGRCR